MKGVKNGVYQGIFSASKTKERQQFLIYPKVPLEAIDYIFVTTKGTKPKWNDKKNLKELPQPIGSPKGWSVTKMLLQNIGLDIDASATDDRSNFRKLLAGRVKTIAIMKTSAKILAKELSAEERVQFLKPSFLSEKPYYLAISKRYGDSIKRAKELATGISSSLKTMGAE